MMPDPHLFRDSSTSAFVIDVSQLGHWPGAIIRLTHRCTSTEPIGLDLIRIPADQEIVLDLQCESVSEGILVTGTLHAPLEGECTRCLNPIARTIELPLTELFLYPHNKTDDDDDVMCVIDDTIDLYQSIIDSVGLDLPFSPVCHPDCQGLCPECGIVLAHAELDHHHDKIDPRWQQLAHLWNRSPSSGTDS